VKDCKTRNAVRSVLERFSGGVTKAAALEGGCEAELRGGEVLDGHGQISSLFSEWDRARERTRIPRLSTFRLRKDGAS
jgi:hypothetical protein